MSNLYTKLLNALKDESGQDMVEYAIMAGMIVVAAVASIQSIGGWVSGQFSALASALGV